MLSARLEYIYIYIYIYMNSIYTAIYYQSLKSSKTNKACCRSKNKVISDVLLWIPSHWRASIGRSRRTYMQQLCMDTGCRLKDLLGAMDNRNGWRERERESGKFMPAAAAAADDDDDDIRKKTWYSEDVFIYIWIICQFLTFHFFWKKNYLQDDVSSETLLAENKIPKHQICVLVYSILNVQLIYSK